MTEQDVRAGLARLAQAVRDGAKLRPQGFGDYEITSAHQANHGDADGPLGATCAVGAAFHALTGRSPASSRNLAAALSDVEGTIIGSCGLPSEVWFVSPKGERYLFVWLEEMNDEERLTREAIADTVGSAVIARWETYEDEDEDDWDGDD